MPGVGSDLLQRLGYRPEQQAVADPLVLQCQWHSAALPQTGGVQVWRSPL